MLEKLDATLRFHEQALGLRAQRQQLLASNVANSDTPNFKAKDIDFNRALADALASRPTSGALRVTSARHLVSAAEPHTARAGERTPRQVSTDGNTVDLDVERAQFASNAVHYEANLTFLSMQLTQLLSAIQG